MMALEPLGDIDAADDGVSAERLDPAAPETIETISITATVLRLDLVHGGGRLLALATVEIDIAGIVIGISGVRVVRLGPHRLGVEAPVWRAGAQSRPAVILPPELTAAIAGAVLDVFQAGRDDAARARAVASGGRLISASPVAAVIGPAPAETRRRAAKSIFNAMAARPA